MSEKGRDWTAEYEALAKRFYEDTGLFAPGKSVPLALTLYQPIAERRKAWTRWLFEEE